MLQTLRIHGVSNHQQSLHITTLGKDLFFSRIKIDFSFEIIFDYMTSFDMIITLVKIFFHFCTGPWPG